MTEALSLDVELELPFDGAVERVTAALKEEGFDVLTRIDVDKALKEKLDIEFRPYTILGACNPTLAHKALSVRPEAGLLLPCNVVVEAVAPDRSLVRIVNARRMMNAAALGGDPAVAEIGEEAHERLGRVAQSLRLPD